MSSPSGSPFCWPPPGIGGLARAAYRDSVPAHARPALEKVSPDLQRVILGADRAKRGTPIPVIVQGDITDGDAAPLAGLVDEDGAAVARRLPVVNGFALEASEATILALSENPAVSRISLDAEVRAAKTR